MKGNGKITATITVTNSGNYDGEEVVQLYIVDPVAAITQPVKKLKGFQKIFLKRGESKDVQFTIGMDELKFVNSELKWVVEPGEFRVQIGTSSDNVKEAAFQLVK